MPAIAYFGVLIPIIAVCIPLVAVTGRYVVQPLVQALAQLNDVKSRELSPAATEQIARLEGRLEEMERMLAHVLEEQEFQKALQAPASGTTSLPASRG